MLTMTESLIVAAVLLALLAMPWGRLVDWVRRTADRDWSATLDDRAHMWDGRPGGDRLPRGKPPQRSHDHISHMSQSFGHRGRAHDRDL